MHELLGVLGEQHWRSWIAQDIDEWERRKSVSHHLLAYGGMGSFNDIGFEDVWLGTLFNDLRSACHHFAHCPTAKPDGPSLEQSMGNVGFELSGWRCLACGYGVVSRRDIDYFLAHRIIRRGILSEAERSRLLEFVQSVVRTRPTDTLFTQANMAAWISASGLNRRDNNDWLRPCPSCGSHDTAVYRWSLLTERGYRFVPSVDNLPLRSMRKLKPAIQT